MTISGRRNLNGKAGVQRMQDGEYQVWRVCAALDKASQSQLTEPPGWARIPCFKLFKIAVSVCFFFFFFSSEGYTAYKQAHLETIPDGKTGFLANFPHIWICLKSYTQCTWRTALPLGRRGTFPPDEAWRAETTLEPWGGCREAGSRTAEKSLGCCGT